MHKNTSGNVATIYYVLTWLYILFFNISYVFLWLCLDITLKVLLHRNHQDWKLEGWWASVPHTGLATIQPAVKKWVSTWRTKKKCTREINENFRRRNLIHSQCYSNHQIWKIRTVGNSFSCFMDQCYCILNYMWGKSPNTANLGHFKVLVQMLVTYNWFKKKTSSQLIRCL